MFIIFVHYRAHTYLFASGIIPNVIKPNYLFNLYTQKDTLYYITDYTVV